MSLTRKQKRELRKRLKAHWHAYIMQAEVSIGCFPDVSPEEWDFLQQEQRRLAERFAPVPEET